MDEQIIVFPLITAVDHYLCCTSPPHRSNIFNAQPTLLEFIPVCFTPGDSR